MALIITTPAEAPRVGICGTRTARFKAKLCGIAVIALPLLGATVTAGDWHVVPRLSIEETYTDNVRLSAQDRSGDFITTITPGISVRGKSARVTSSIDFNRQQRFFADQSQFNGGNNQLQAAVDSTLVKNWLFFAGNSRMSQQSIDNRLSFSRLDRGTNGNLNDVTSYELTPRIAHTFGSLGSMDLSYARQSINRSLSNNNASNGPSFFNAAASSSDADSFAVDLRSGSATGRFPIGINASSREATFGNGRIEKFKRVGADLSYILNSHFRFTGRGGYDDNQFSSNRGLNSGPTWSIGGTWTPSSRTSMLVDWGDHFFGKALKVNVDHHHRRWHFSFRYDKDARTNSDYQRALQLVPLFDVNGQPVFDPNGQIFVPIDSPGAIADVFIEKNLTAQVAYKLRRSELHLSFFKSDRAHQSTIRNERNTGMTFDIDRALRPRLHANLGAQWREIKDSTLKSSGTYYSIFPSLTYELNRYATARLRYEYTDSDHGDLSGLGFISDRQRATYIENAVTASLILHL